MGACSSVEVADHDFPALSRPVPPGLPAALSSQKESHETSSPSIAPTSGSPVHPSLLAALAAVASRASLSTSTSVTAASASQRPSARHSTSTSVSKAQPTLRLGSLTLDHDDDSVHANSPTAASSRRVTGDSKTEQAKVAPLAAAAVVYRSNVSPKHAEETEARSRGSALLNGARQERVAAEEREQQTAWKDTKGKAEEEKTQDDGETKRGSGRSRFSIVKAKPPTTPLAPNGHKQLVEPVTPPSPAPVVITYLSVDHAAAQSTARSAAGALKKSASLDGGLKLPAAPAIPTQRISSEVDILDVIRQLGRSQSVSVNTLSQYTRCVPAVLSGPLTRSPRGSGPVASALPCCAKLQCTRCLMDVMMLDHHRWVADVRSDTFRSSYPEVARLRSSLVAAVGSRAYCCACSWADVKEQVAVDEQLRVGGADCKERIRWVCAGHQ